MTPRNFRDKYRCFGETCPITVLKIWDHISRLISFHANVTLDYKLREFPGFANSIVLSEGMLVVLSSRQGGWNYAPGEAAAASVTPVSAWLFAHYFERSVWPLVLYGNKQNAFILQTVKILFINTDSTEQTLATRNMFIFIRSAFTASKRNFELNGFHYTVY